MIARENCNSIAPHDRGLRTDAYSIVSDNGNVRSCQEEEEAKARLPSVKLFKIKG